MSFLLHDLCRFVNNNFKDLLFVSWCYVTGDKFMGMVDEHSPNRNSMAIPLFSFEATVSESTAKQDKVEIGIEDVLLYGDAAEVADFLDYLGVPPRNQRTEAEVNPFGRFFNRQHGREPRFDRQTIRARPLSVGGQNHPPPLVAGWFEVHPLPSESWRTETRLSLNPTRYTRHQLVPSRMDLFQLEPPFHRFAVNDFSRAIDGFYADEFALVESDNWIPNSRSWQRFTSETFWPHHLRNCLTRLPEALLGEFQRVAELVTPRPHLGGLPRHNLRSVETYWEFLSNDPLGTVLSLEPMLRMFSARFVSTEDYPCAPVADVVQNSRCLKLQTRTGETFKIYAKTNRRIRFEVLHQLTGERGFRVPQGGHTFLEIEEMFPLLAHLTAIATVRVNEVLRHFRLHASVPVQQHAVLKFLHDFQSAFELPERALQLLQIFTNNGSLVVGHGIPLRRAFGSELDRLVNNGILSSSNGRYSVTRPYEQAFRQLQQRGIGFLLGTRIRRRISP